jgi:hypothetical protein
MSHLHEPELQRSRNRDLPIDPKSWSENDEKTMPSAVSRGRRCQREPLDRRRLDPRPAPEHRVVLHSQPG